MRVEHHPKGASAWRRLAGLVIPELLSAIALGSCNGGGSPWPPQLPQEKGPGAVSGTFVLRGPSLAIYTQGPQQAAPPIYAGWQANAALGLFREGSQYVVRELPAQWLQPSSAQQGTLSIPFDFTEVPLGTYRIRLFYTEYIAESTFNRYGYLSAGEPFILKAATPVVSGRQDEWGLLGPPPYCEVSGKLLTSGNSMGDTQFGVGIYENPAGAWAGLEQMAAGMRVPASPGQYGRLFYKISYLPLGRFDIWADGLVTVPSELGPVRSYSILRIDGLISATNKLELLPDAEVPAVDIFCPRFADPRGQDGYDDPLLQGRILATVRFVGATSWTSDIVAVAERLGTSSGPRNVATYFILPMGLRLDRSVECFLGYLDPGTYTVAVYQLGETNADPPLRLALAESVPLPIPPLAEDVDHNGNPYTYQPVPVARVALDVDLPAALSAGPRCAGGH